MLSTDELLAQLATPTQVKYRPGEEPVTGHTATTTDTTEIEGESNSTHTSDPISETAETDIPSFSTDDFADEAIQPPADTVKDKNFWTKQAKFWLGTFNMLQKKALPFIYKKSILKEGDSVILNDWREKKRKNPNLLIEDAITEDDQLFHALDRYEQLDAACSSIAFTEEEMQTLTEPLAAVLEKHQAGGSSPETQLAIALVIVMLPRLLPFFPGLSNFTLPTR
ncbi:hypothetical protein QNI19_16515 [Cytophagaceae bacterium DM2B3-1]|uniref:Uncharacterized protein n=1 Tax=Xanthocytophaga flava TaxID=3048013 RepID=A0ABT7CLC3_9BACT|nr:hypothetical protein [Xanthocytophaga flavus]MDJ1494550.1 hypothetical protein [Xanthocytophaga flavus]